MIRFPIVFLFLFITSTLIAQRVPNIHIVQLKDKNNSNYSIYKPWEFLSARSIDRRNKAGIAITESDLPVKESYVKQLENTGVKIKAKSKWMNSVLVVADESQLKSIQQFPFVLKTSPVGFDRKPRETKIPKEIPKVEYDKLENRYGYAGNQIRMLQGHIIHLLGYEGEGKMVGVLDGGFVNVDVLPFFDSLRVNGNLLPSKDMVDMDDYAYEDTGHGTQVLSTMGANLPGMMVGTAPAATYICIKTEEIGAENPVEIEYWIAGLEYADSLGVDVINSSLGYTTFDLKELNHEKSKLDGQTYRGSIAASIAARKGILIFNSAGNEGSGGWRTVGVPADAFDIVAVGAVDVNKKKANFSSEGFSADGRIKPDLSAMGKRTAVANLKGYKVSASNGTSFSSPVLAGMATSLWSAFPDRSWIEIKDALINSGSNLHEPDSLLGYGIPDFTKAYAQLSGMPVSYHNFERGTRLFTKDNRYQILFKKDDDFSNYEIRNTLGEVVQKGKELQDKEMGFLNIQLNKDLPFGIYQVVIISGSLRYNVHIIHENKLPIYAP